jgi:LysR family glycine cleavage system transcriptional activator
MIMPRILPGTRALRTFEAAARHLNFTRAAAEVGLTPAAVSYQIREIEEQLGMALFTRTSRSIVLTPAGDVLRAATVEALGTLRRAVGQARNLARGAGPLRLSLGPRFATNWLLPRLERWNAAHPDIELAFDITDDVCEFEAGAIDAAIRFGAGAYPGTQSHRLFDAAIIAVCSPRLLDHSTSPRTPHDLLRHTLCHVDCQVDGAPWPGWGAWMDAAGVDGFDAGRCLAFADSSHVVQAVIDGGAVGLVERDLVAADLANGRLVRLFDVAVRMAPQHAYHLVYPASSADNVRILALRDWLLAEVGEVAVTAPDAPAPESARCTAPRS